MTHQENYNLSTSIIEELAQKGLDGIHGCVRVMLNSVMQAERSNYLQAEAYQRTEDRKGHANGYKPEAIETSSFADIIPGEDGYWAIDWIEAIYKFGVTKGCGEDPLIYCPEKKVTRAEMAVFLVRAFDLD
mgnify:CR=1 FL=1